jgi:hypothetical protein
MRAHQLFVVFSFSPVGHLIILNPQQTKKKKKKKKKKKLYLCVPCVCERGHCSLALRRYLVSERTRKENSEREKVRERRGEQKKKLYRTCLIVRKRDDDPSTRFISE